MTWPTKKLGEVCNLVRGSEPGSAAYIKESDDTFPFLRVGDLSGKVDNPKFASKELQDLTIVDPSEILVTFDGTPGLVTKGWKGAISSGIRVIRNIKENEILKDFLFYYLQTPPVQEAIRFYTTGVTILHASRAIPHIKIKIPPRPIQQEIVERLDAIRKTQELNEKQISLADELLNSLIRKEILDSPWKEVKLGGVVRDQEFTNPKKKPNVRFNYVEISSLHPETKQIIQFRQVLGKKAPSRARKVLRDGDTVWSTVRPYLKNIAHVIHLPNPKVASTGFCVLSPRSKVIDHNWLYYNVSSDWFIKKVLPFQKGASYPATSDDDILNQTIKFAPIKEQRRIAKKLSAVQEYKKKLLRQKELLQELFESTLDKAMRGELGK